VGEASRLPDLLSVRRCSGQIPVLLLSNHFVLEDSNRYSVMPGKEFLVGYCVTGDRMSGWSSSFSW